MKKILKTTYSLLATLFFIFIFNQCGQSQVFTRILSDQDDVRNYFFWFEELSPPAIELPAVSVQAVLEKDKKLQNPFSRYGIVDSLKLNTNDGTFYNYGNFKIWKIKISSKEATSLNFKFSGLNIPKGGEMVVFNSDFSMFHGPITEANIKNAQFLSDLVYGDECLISVFLPKETFQNFSITLDYLIYGIKERPIESRDIGESLGCNVDIVCDEGDDWQNEAKSVCFIFDGGGDEVCTGTLVTNECNDFRPFVLTAAHCLSGVVNSYMFRFNYQSLVCGSDVYSSNTWITYSGTQIRAAWNGTDFGLLELDDPILSSQINFAGWDRSSNVPENSTWIHHPQGDGKKITQDADDAFIETGIPDGSDMCNSCAFGVTLSNDANGDFGVLENRSSGSAHFNQNHRIVGQHWGGDTQGCQNTVMKYEGRFHTSWEGNGSSNTRLNDWLGGVINPQTTNTLIRPTISGDDVICTSSKNYILQNPVPEYTVTWSVTPAILFGSSTSGSGTTASLYAASAYVSGQATLTFTLSNSNCEDQTFSKDIWVGKPGTPQVQLPECFNMYDNYVLNVHAGGATYYDWYFPSCPNGTPTGDPDPECWYNYTGNGTQNQIFVYAGEQGGYISVFAYNECGFNSRNFQIHWCDPQVPGPGPIIRMVGKDLNNQITMAEDVVVYPNPTQGSVKVSLADKFEDGIPKEIYIYSNTGKQIFSTLKSENNFSVELNNPISGIYYMRLIYKGQIFIKRIILI